MVVNNEDPKATAFTITVDAKEGISTGISAGDRALTLRMLANPEVISLLFSIIPAGFTFRQYFLAVVDFSSLISLHALAESMCFVL